MLPVFSKPCMITLYNINISLKGTCMKIVNKVWCAGVLSLVSLSVIAADLGLSGAKIVNSPTYTEYDGVDDAVPQSWAEVANTLLFYKKDSPYYEFTNFYAAPIVIASQVWPTSEHYYQAMKFTNTAIQDQIRAASTAREAFEIGQRYRDSVRSDWRAMSLSTMGYAVYEKFKQNPVLAALLLTTGTKVLIEDAKAKDSFFGAGANYKGHNYLGRILMLVRVILGAKQAQ